jgi:hypothetical protein
MGKAISLLQAKGLVLERGSYCRKLHPRRAKTDLFSGVVNRTFLFLDILRAIAVRCEWRSATWLPQCRSSLLEL